MSHNFTKTDDAKLIDLITQAKSGNQTAFEELLRLYDPLIRSMTATFFDANIPVLDREDIRQEAMLGFYQAMLGFDLEESITFFGSYAKICIRNRLISYLREQKRHEKMLLTDNDAALMQEADDTEGDPSVKILEWETFEELTRLIRNHLSSYENRIWWLYLSGKTAKEIGMLLGKDEKSVQNAVYRIRRKLRDVITYS